MGKMNELSMLTEELRKCGETLISISEELAGMFSGYAEEKQPVKRLLLKGKSRGAKAGSAGGKGTHIGRC